MATSAARAATDVADARGAFRIPWYIWCAAMAVTSGYVGGYWDIAWHRSIGRDSFWSAPHMAIYACGVLAGITAAFLIFQTTFASSAPFREVSARIWGLSGPIGAFILAWGGVAMLVSAPFDDWWHNAYGLDVRIISPPHMVLALGFFGIELGTVVLVLAFMNRATGRARASLERLFLYVGATAVCESMLVKIEYTSRSDMHNALFYIVVSIGTPMVLVAIAVASGRRWAATTLAAIYSAFMCVFLWVFPLFPARPALGPVYREITHFIPAEFPILLLVPAVVADLILRRTQAWRPIGRAVLVGLAFLGALVIVQWTFANFLMSPAARNWFFGTEYMDFATPPASSYARFVFIHRETAELFWIRMAIAAAIICLMSWFGLRLGQVMARVRR